MSLARTNGAVATERTVGAGFPHYTAHEAYPDEGARHPCRRMTAAPGKPCRNSSLPARATGSPPPLAAF
jgi:hypothetical protein